MLKQIKDFPNYFIDEEGGVYSIKRKKYLKPRYDSHGYLYVRLYKNGKMFTKLIHRLVALAFIPKTEEDIKLNRDYIDHINGVRDDNRIENLRWCTIKENNNFPLYKENMSKAQSKQPIIIDGIEYRSIRQAARELNIPLTTIHYRLNNPKFKNYFYKDVDN